MNVKPYMKKNGEVMLFINSETGASLGVNQGETPWMSTKLTQGAMKITIKLDELKQVFTEKMGEGAVYTNHGDENIGQLKFRLDFGREPAMWMAITDTANVGGVSTGCDGLFLVIDGVIFMKPFAN